MGQLLSAPGPDPHLAVPVGVGVVELHLGSPPRDGLPVFVQVALQLFQADHAVVVGVDDGEQLPGSSDRQGQGRAAGEHGTCAQTREGRQRPDGWHSVEMKCREVVGGGGARSNRIYLYEQTRQVRPAGRWGSACEQAQQRRTS